MMIKPSAMLWTFAGLLFLAPDCAAKSTPIRLGIMYGYQVFGNRDLVGLDAELLVAGSTTSRNSAGVLVSPGITFSARMKGVQVGMLNGAFDLWGLQIGGFNLVDRNLTGMQIGLCNGFAFSSAYNPNLQDIGLKIGLINERVRGITWGADIGLLNSEAEIWGLQLGLVNRTEILHGIQVGLLNVVKHRKGLGHILPIMNASF